MLGWPQTVASEVTSNTEPREELATIAPLGPAARGVRFASYLPGAGGFPNPNEEVNIP